MRAGLVAGVILSVVSVAGCSKGAPSFSALDKELLAPPSAPPPAPMPLPSAMAPIVRLPGHEGMIVDLAFTPDGTYLVSVGDQTLRLWKTGDGRVAQTVKMAAVPCGVCVTPDGSTIITTDAAQKLTFWPLRNGRIGMPEEMKETLGHSPKLALSPNGRLLAVASFDKFVTIWNVADKMRLRRIDTPQGLISIAFSPDGRSLAAGGDGTTFHLWDLSRGSGMTCTVSKVTEGTQLLGLAFSGDGKYLATGHNESTISVWDLEKRAELHNWFVPNATTMAVKFRPDGKVLVTGQATGTLFLWNPVTRQQLAYLDGHKGMINCLAFSPDGRTLASGGEDKMIVLWR